MPYFSPDYPFPGDAYLYFGKGLAKIFHRLQEILWLVIIIFRQLRKFIGRVSDAAGAATTSSGRPAQSTKSAI
ncbi:hypothetical protein DMH27_24835 [Raoultella planticola]|nr:hypothetical protein [Raoultella planticola]